MEGALRAIRYAREQGVPFLGTCGGFQHALIEYARNVLGLRTADHAESNPYAELPLMVPLTCALVESSGTIILRPGSRSDAIYGRAETVELYHCSFGLNPHYQEQLVAGGLLIAGVDHEGETRMAELPDHPFFVVTLFQPERSSRTGTAHPLIVAYIEAAAAYARQRDQERQGESAPPQKPYPYDHSAVVPAGHE
jgi:CTP synthase (UTP-ammonia lyase)